MARTILICVLLASSACLELTELPAGNPPPPPRPRELPPELLAAFPKNERGGAIFNNVNFGAMNVELGYDAALDDPIARWGQCVGRVVDCTKTNPSGSIAGCVVQIERCADAEGGEGCCPETCIEEFRTAWKRTEDDLDALEASILRGTCVERVSL